MTGTVVLLNKDLKEEEVATLIDAGETTNTTIIVNRVMKPSDIHTIHIVHGGECLELIMDHLKLGQKLLQHSTPRMGGLLFCAQYFGLHIAERKDVDAFFAAEAVHAMENALSGRNLVKHMENARDKLYRM
jgi:hypothetical protein